MLIFYADKVLVVMAIPEIRVYLIFCDSTPKAKIRCVRNILVFQCTMGLHVSLKIASSCGDLPPPI